MGNVIEKSHRSIVRQDSVASDSIVGQISLRRRDQSRLAKQEIEFREIKGPLFAGDPKPTAPRQGCIGDCYLLAALSAVARSAPQLIESMISPDGNGSYTVTFYKRVGNGNFRPETVSVDARVPVQKGGGQPLYACTLPDAKGQIETWPLIAEKAYAKWKGGYNIIGEGGAVEDTLEEITGQPTRMLYVAEHNPEVLWKMLSLATRNGWPAAVCTYGRTERPGLDELGLHPNHIHIFLGVHAWRNRRIVWLRDPFDRPTCGTLIMPDPNGVFTLSWENFITYFAEVEINDKMVLEVPSPPYPLTTIMQALEHSYVFHSLDPESKRKLARNFIRHSIPAHEFVFRSGSMPDYYYLIKSGSAGVEVREKGSARKWRVAVLNAGDQFGEIALINNTVRLADIKAITPLALYRLPARAFHRWVSLHPELIQRFRRRFELQVWMQKWVRRPITSISLDMLLDAGKEQAYPKGEIVIRQGDLADSFYIILKGKVEIFQTSSGGARKRIKTLGDGDIFGEVAALKRMPRTASVRAIAPCKLLRLDIGQVSRLTESFEVLQRQLEFIARRRARRLKGLHRHR